MTQLSWPSAAVAFTVTKCFEFDSFTMPPHCLRDSGRPVRFLIFGGMYYSAGRCRGDARRSKHDLDLTSQLRNPTNLVWKAGKEVILPCQQMSRTVNGASISWRLKWKVAGRNFQAGKKNRFSGRCSFTDVGFSVVHLTCLISWSMFTYPTISQISDSSKDLSFHSIFHSDGLCFHINHFCGSYIRL